MTDKQNTGPEEAVRGVVEGVKGKAKEVIGTVTGRDDLVREGQAQQDKADAQSMRSAIYAAIDIVEHRRAWTEWSRNPLQRAEREKGGRDISVKDLPQTERED